MRSPMLLIVASLGISGVAIAFKPTADSVLKGTCIQVDDAGRKTATVDCIQQLNAEKSQVFKFYRTVPNTNGNGQMDGYVLFNSKSSAAHAIREIHGIRKDASPDQDAPPSPAEGDVIEYE